jgi:hypothetical protein
MANAGGTAGIGIKLLTRKDTGAQQIIGLVPGGAAKLSGMLQENDTLLKVRFCARLQQLRAAQRSCAAGSTPQKSAGLRTTTLHSVAWVAGGARGL